MPVRIGSKPQPRIQQTAERYASPQARMKAVQVHANKLIEGGKLEFNGKAPKKTDIARQFEVRNVRPFTYTAIELKTGEIVIKKVLTGGFVPARPGDGSYTAPMKFPELAKA